MKYELGVILIIGLGLFATVWIQHVHNESLDNTIQLYKNQIAQLHVDAEDAANKYKAAQATADKQMNEAQKQSNAIMKQKVSNDCNQAVAWLVAQRKLL